DLDYSMEGLGRFVEAFADARGLERMRLVVHDWGVVGLLFAMRAPERIERLAVIDAIPLLPGYRWHALAHAGEGLGRLASPALVLWGARDPYIPASFAQAWADALPDATARVVDG